VGDDVILNLGMIEAEKPYADGGKTVGDVAQILEDKFDVMQIFADQNEEMIARSLEAVFAGAVESAIAGKYEELNVLGEKNYTMYGNIIERFHEFIDRQEHGILLKKQTEKTAKAGARFKRQYRKVSNSLAFYETGAYEGHFGAWVD
jgi:hypothetical protein